MNRRFMIRSRIQQCPRIRTESAALAKPHRGTTRKSSNALIYGDATNSDQRLIIDQWVAKGRDEQRGVIFTTDPEKLKHKGKKRGEAKRIPPYWIKAFKTLRSKEAETRTTTNRGKNNKRNSKSRTIWGGHLIEMTLSMIKERCVEKYPAT